MFWRRVKSQANRRESEWSHKALVSNRLWMGYLPSEYNSSWQMWNLGNESGKSRILSIKLWYYMNSLVLGHSTLHKSRPPGQLEGRLREWAEISSIPWLITSDTKRMYCFVPSSRYFLHRGETGEGNWAIYTYIIQSLHCLVQSCQEKQQSE